ncbi:hypothetical protein Dimus_012930 [Dionaea muscipula]
MKADREMVMEDNQTLENKNKELKSALEGEKGKEHTLEDKVKELQAALEREKERCSKKNDELVSSYSKYLDILRKEMNLDTSMNVRKEENEKLQTVLAQMKEKRKIVEECLPKQLKFVRKEAVREYLGSEECSAKFNGPTTKQCGASAFMLQNGFKIGMAQVWELLMDDDDLIPELEKMKINPKVKYEKKLIPPIEGEPTVWSEDYEVDPMKFIKE